LSSSIALETFALIPALAKQIGDDELFTAILRLAAEIANRSAKHSADFLQKTPRVAETLKSFGSDKSEVAESVIALARAFCQSNRRNDGGLWQICPRCFVNSPKPSINKKAAEYF
jgi:hypothetical protein